MKTCNVFPRTLLALVAACFMAAHAAADIEFVQITDPHIFDAKRPAELPDNRAAFAACIEKVNALHGTNRFSFVAMTGDIGLDSLNDRDFAKGVSEFRSYLTNSAVKTWLFVPGNNDLDGEFPTNIHKYHRFISSLSNELQGMIQIIDLCPTGTSSNNSRSSSFSVRSSGIQFRFFGFDTASFKNDNNGTNAKAFASQQAQNVQSLLLALTNVTNGFAYVLYHIPEIDDPVFTFGPAQDLGKRQIQKTFVGDDWLYSAWMVSPVVRQEWEKVVRHPAVKGLIAGHFHAQSRAAYQQFDWLKTNYSSVAAHKFFVAPPVAGKFQSTNGPTARGFRIYSANQFGNLVGITYWLQDGQLEPAPPLHPGGGFELNPRQPTVPSPPSSHHSDCDWVCTLAFSYLILGSLLVAIFVCWEMTRRRNHFMLDHDEMQNVRRSNLFFLPIFHIALSAVLVFLCCPRLGTILLWTVAWFSMGTLLGLIFSVPKSSARPPGSVPPPSHPEAAADAHRRESRYETNNNLVEVSDWLTKIIVGLGLIHLKDAGTFLKKAAQPLEACLGPECYLAFGIALILAFLSLGFLFGYVFTRLFLVRAFSDADPSSTIAHATHQMTMRTLETKGAVAKGPPGPQMEMSPILASTPGQEPSVPKAAAEADWKTTVLDLARQYSEDNFASIFRRVAHKDRLANEIANVLSTPNVPKETVADLLKPGRVPASSSVRDGLLAGLASYIVAQPGEEDMALLLAVAPLARRLHAKYRLIMAFSELVQNSYASAPELRQLSELIQGWLPTADSDLAGAILALQNLIAGKQG